MNLNNELKYLADKLKPVFKDIFGRVKERKAELNDRTLDQVVLDIAQGIKIQENNISIAFSEPQDTIYSAKKGRTPYDLLCYGKVNDKPFNIFINNKFGNINGNARNDVTTYNNLLRLYLNLNKQMLNQKITIPGDIIYKRISGKEIVSYALFVIDINKNDYRFFFLEEVKDELYVNPRNTMLQIKYNPTLGEPTDYYDFCNMLIDKTVEALTKKLNTTKAEILVLKNLKKLFVDLRNG